MYRGALIDGRFVIESEVGVGAMGKIFRARDRQSNRVVAIKVLSVQQESARDRFAREARLLSGLQHPGIVTYVADGFIAPDKPYLAMEWLNGRDLAKRLRQGPLSVADSIMVVTQVADALAYAHQQGVVHRDIKPSNLFLCNDRIDQMRLIDFGIGRALSDSDSPSQPLTAAGIVVGTPGYIAPEQVRASDQVGPAADVFALGVVLFECITGRRAFLGRDDVAVFAKILFEDPPLASEFCPDIPPALERLLGRMLCKSPKDRLSDGAAVAAELRALDHQESAAHSDRQSLSGGELRIVSVVMASDSYLSDPPSNAPTMPNLILSGRDDTLEQTTRELGGYLEQLSDGSLIVQMRGRGAATDTASHAARAALTIRERLPHMAIVLATGRGRADGRLPVGDVIDRAAALLRTEMRAATLRVESGSSAQECGIRIDEVTASLLDTRFMMTGDDHGLLLSGIREPLEVKRTLLGTAAPFVGRSRELGNLLATLEECLDDSVARGVVVIAAPGIGKSRLCAEFLQRIPGREQLRLFLARGEMVGAGSSFGLLAQGLRRTLGIHEGEPLAVRRKKLAAQASRYFSGDRLDRVATFLGELIGTRLHDEPTSLLRAALQDARAMGDQMRQAWLDWANAAAAERPMLIVLDDLHWGDLPTVKTIDVTLRTLKDRAIMVLALARPEVNERFPSLWSGRGVEHVWLTELSTRASQRLVQSVLAGKLDQVTVDRLVEQSAGNAFYLEELIRAAAEGHVEAPESVLAMVQARLDKLPPETRRILRAASVFGETFWLGGVIALLAAEDNEEQVRERLQALIDGEFIQRSSVSRFDSQVQYVFNHALVRDATYSTLTATDSKLGHRLAGQWLKQRGETDAMVLAEHFERGGELGRAVEFFVRATQQALESDELDEVHARAQRAVSCGASGKALGEIRLAQTEAFNWQGSFRPAMPYAIETVYLIEPHTDLWYRAVGELAVVSWRLNKRAPLLGIADRLLSVTTPRLTPAYVSALALVGSALLEFGDTERLESLRAIVASRRPDAEHLFWPWADYFFYIEGGRNVSAEIAAQLTALDAFRRDGNRRRYSLTSMNLGFLWIKLGMFERAEPVLKQALAEAETMGLDQLIAAAQNNLGECLGRVGKMDEALELGRKSVASYQQYGLRRLEAAARSALARIHSMAGDLADAEREARIAVKQTETIPRLHCSALGTLGMILLHRGGHVEEALKVTTKAKALLDEVQGNVEEGEALVRLAYAEALHASGRVREARVAIAEARSRLLESKNTIDNAEWAQCYIKNVSEHARTLELAEAWGAVDT